MMNKKEILSKAGGILTELNEQYEYLSRSPENLNELELELFSANANFLSDHLAILVKLNSHTEKPETKPVQPDASVYTEEPKAIEKPDLEMNEADKSHGDKLELEEAEAEITEEVVVEQEVQPSLGWKFDLEKEPDLTFDFEETQPDKLFDRPLTEDEMKVINEKTKLRLDSETQADLSESKKNTELQTERELEAIAKEESEKKNDTPEEEKDDVHIKEVVISERTIAVSSDQIRDENPVPTINDILSRNITHQTVSSQFNTRQTKDLKGMISLNDKLLFVRDLFNGYSLAYSEAIELLNRFDNFEAADNFLKQNYAGKNNWSAKQDVADKFYEVLSRRFSK